MLLEEIEKFLESVDLSAYREKYRPIKIVEMDLPKEIQATDITLRDLLLPKLLRGEIGLWDG